MSDPTPPLRPRGKALRRTDRQLATVAKVSKADEQDALDLWQANCDPKYKNLLLAKKEGT